MIRTVELLRGGDSDGQLCDSGFGTAVAVVPGAAVGLPQDPVLLVTACADPDGEFSEQSSRLYFFRPSGGTSSPVLVVQTLEGFEGQFPFSGSWGSLAFRADKGDLIGCRNSSFNDEGTSNRVYRIPLSKNFTNSDGLPTTSVVQLFHGVTGDTPFCSGLAWDSVDNKIHQNPRGSSQVFRFPELGGEGSEANILVPQQCNPFVIDGKDVVIGRASGLALSGQSLFIGCGGDPKIFRVNKSNGAVLESFGSAGLQTSDMECDPVTFGAQQKDVLWTKGAFESSLIAVEVERGSCGGTPPVAAGTLCVTPAGTPDLTDTDGDGLLDCWERPSPVSAGMSGQPCIDFDGDGTCDLALCVDSGDGKGTVCANPYRKDVFVEIDWLENHKPNQQAITKVINRFEVAPVSNPNNPATNTSIPGIRLHVLLDDVLRNGPATTAAVIQHNPANLFGNGLMSFEPYTAAPGALDFDVLKRDNFGTMAQRANPKALDAKRQAFRYVIFGHLISGLGGSSGAAEVHGNDGIVSLGAASTTGHGVGSVDQQAGTFMHELGHLLGLRHGGGDFVGCKPNYLSVMNYARQFPGAPLSATQWNLTGLDYSRSELPTLDKSSLNEQTGVSVVLGNATVFGPGAGLVRSTNGPIDWNRNGATGAGVIAPIPGLNQIGTGNNIICSGDGLLANGTVHPLGTLLPGYNDWANLKYDVRSSLDVADGSRVTLLEDRQPEIGFEAPADNPCAVPGTCPVALNKTDEGVVDTDGDGVPDLHDNCPTIPNPLQNNVCAETAVSIDIRPFRYPNTVRLDSIFPLAVAIHGSSTFDVLKIRPETIKLAEAKVIRVGPIHLCTAFDENKDGFLDLVCVVNKRDLVVPGDAGVAVLTGKTRTNADFRGEDSIHIIRGKSHHDDD